MTFGIDDAIAAGLQVLNKFVPDPQARAQAEAELRGSLLQWDIGQQRINEKEAESASLFAAGWRPAIGWTCAAALAFEYLFSPLAQWIGFMIGHPIPKPPTLSDNLYELMFGMLGLGALRSLEKIKGVR